MATQPHPGEPRAPDPQGDEGVLPAPGTRKARRLLLALALLQVVTTAVSLAYNLRAAGERHDQLALATGRSIFAQAVLTRRWNAQHGGVYVPVTAATQPNPYLDDPKRDLVSTDGQRLTKLNPAFMTRLISEVMQKEHGTQLHITSLRPIRPENAPDPWERSALESFERGAAERSGVLGRGEAALYRYMAPLRTEASCLPCHARQGYQVGDIRGGISVTIPYAPFARSLGSGNRVITAAHLLFLTVGLTVIAFLGRALVARIREVEESQRHIRTLEGLLPICAGCKKIRAPGGDPRDPAAWEPLEQYIEERTDASFTHGYCPECAKKYFGKYARP
jgi:hypothetical protein